MVFYESVGLKILYSLTVIIIATVAYYILQQYEHFDAWRDTWQFQAASVSGVSLMIFIWLEGSVVFDEMMQIVIIKSWFRKILPAKKIYYAEIKAVIFKRFAHEDEDGHITNEGYFHLQLHNGKSYLVMVFKHKDTIENARKKLMKHTKLKITSY